MAAPVAGDCWERPCQLRSATATNAGYSARSSHPSRRRSWRCGSEHEDDRQGREHSHHQRVQDGGGGDAERLHNWATTASSPPPHTDSARPSPSSGSASAPMSCLSWNSNQAGTAYPTTRASLIPSQAARPPSLTRVKCRGAPVWSQKWSWEAAEAHVSRRTSVDCMAPLTCRNAASSDQRRTHADGSRRSSNPTATAPPW